MRENGEGEGKNRQWKRRRGLNGDSEQIYVLNYILVPLFSLAFCITFYLFLYCVPVKFTEIYLHLFLHLWAAHSTDFLVPSLLSSCFKNSG